MSDAENKPGSNSNQQNETPKPLDTWRLLNVRVGNILAAASMLILIWISILAVVEVSSRTSARSFLEHKIAAENEKLANSVSAPAFPDLNSNVETARSSGSDTRLEVSESLKNKAFYQKQHDRVSYIEFSGAEDESYTVYAIQKNIEKNEINNANQPAIQTIESNLSALRRDSIMLKNEIDALGMYSQSLASENFSSDMSQFEMKTRLDTHIRGIEGAIYKADTSFYNAISESYGLAGNDKFATGEIDYPLTITYLRNSLSAYQALLEETKENLEYDIAQQEKQLNTLKMEAEFLRSGDDNTPPSVKDFDFGQSHFASYRSDVLLAIALVCCGGIGATAAGMRSYSFSSSDFERRQQLWFGNFRDQLLGFSAGFISFLVIKGGKSLFVLQGIETTVFINPYGSALAGIIAGLFTDKAYQLLSGLFDQTAGRLLDDNSSTGNGKKPNLRKSRKVN